MAEDSKGGFGCGKLLVQERILGIVTEHDMWDAPPPEPRWRDRPRRVLKLAQMPSYKVGPFILLAAVPLVGWNLLFERSIVAKLGGVSLILASVAALGMGILWTRRPLDTHGEAYRLERRKKSLFTKPRDGVWDDPRRPR